MAKPQLFLLHFAGGSCYSFQGMAAMLKDFEVIPLELPGRGRRTEERLLKDFDLAAMDFYHQINKKLTSPSFLIYGHSMGAYLSLRVSYMLEQAGKHPACLVVSGNPGPGIRDNKKRYLMGHEEFIRELRKMGGVPDELLANPELLDFFEPILRADFEISEKDTLDKEEIVGCPLYALMGSREDDVEKISNWGRFTRSRFQSEVLEGNHFFIYQHIRRMAEVITDSYRETQLAESRLNAHS